MKKLQSQDCHECRRPYSSCRYYLRKRKSNQSSMTIINCVDCGRPFKAKDSEKEWKKHCYTCWLKQNGVPTLCTSCLTPIIVKDQTLQDLCKACYIKDVGIKKSCEKCTITFYMHQKAQNKNLCYDCYSKKEGVRRKCVDCKSTIFVLKNNMSWKKKCGECYYKI